MGKKQKESDEGKSKLELMFEKLNKAYGKGTIMSLGEKIRDEYDIIPTGSIGFDYKTLGVGGFVKGKLYELIGWEGCIAEDTYIKFITVRKDGIVQDCKGGSIKNLYKRFHQRSNKTAETEFNVVSINEYNRIIRNPIADVVKTGKKECFEVVSEKGFIVKTTKDHKFYVGDRYEPLSNLSIGDTVYIHNNTTYKTASPALIKTYEETTLKYYYKGKRKFINGHHYYRERVSRLTFEAAQNNLTLDEYKKILNNVDKLPDTFWTIPEGYDIHHKDDDCRNNDLSNLELISEREHGRRHAIERHNNLRFIAIPDKIVSITSVGEIETYDIKCFSPYNNFIAEGFVVHNSGKSTVCAHAVAECQKAGGLALYIDSEHAVDPNYFKALGVDIDHLIISQPMNGDEGFNVAMEAIKSGEIDLVVIDSDSSMLPKAVIDGEVGDSAIGKKAKLNSDAYPKLKTALVNNNVCVIVISQYREKIGVMFGDPRTTQGGHALKYYADCRIEMSRSLIKEGDMITGNKTTIKTLKNKTFPPYRKCDFTVVFGKGIDKIEELATLAMDYDVIVKSGGWYSYGDIKLREDELYQLLEDNPELFDEIREKIIEKIKMS